MPPVLAIGLGALGVSSAIATQVSSVLWAGIMIGLSLLFKPDVPKPEATRLPFKQPIPPRMRIIGIRRSAGAYLLYSSANGGTAYIVLAICDGEVNEFSKHYLHDDIVALTGNVVNGVGAGRYGDGKIHLYWRYGVATETAYSNFVSELGTDIWTEDHRGDGIATVAARYADAGIDNQNKRFPFGLPVYSAEVDATRVFNPDNVAHDWADPTTWDFERNANPILQSVWMLTSPIKQGGFGLDFEEIALPVIDDIRVEADICDEAVALKEGGTELRYESHAQYFYNTEPIEALAATIGAGDVFLAERGDGAFNFRAGKWRPGDFDVVIKDKHIISITTKRGREDENDVTGVIVQYNSRAHEHITIDAPVYPVSAYQGGNDRRVRSVNVTNVNSGTQAQRLGKRIYLYETSPLTGTIVLNSYGIMLMDRRGCTIQCSDDPDLADAKLRLTRREFDFASSTVTIDFQVIDPDEVDAWDAATEQGPLQPIITNVPDEGFSIPSSITVVASQISGAIYDDIRFDPGAVAGENTNYTVLWRIQDIGGGVAGNWSQVDFSNNAVNHDDPTGYIVTMTGMPIAVLDFKLQAWQHDRSEFSTIASADNRYPSPGRPTDVDAVLSGSNVDVTWNAPDSANMDHARVYRATSGGGFGTSTDISGPIPGAALDPMNYTDTAPGSGVYDYWVSSENATNVASIPVGPFTVTVP